MEIPRRNFMITATAFSSVAMLGACAPTQVVWGMVRGGLKTMTAGGLTNSVLRDIAVGALIDGALNSAERAAHKVQYGKPYAVRFVRFGQRALALLDWISTSRELIEAVGSSTANQQWRDVGDKSPTAAAMAYYALLQQNERNASQSIWVTPDTRHPAWSPVGSVKSWYEVQSVQEYANNGSTASTRVYVKSANAGDQYWRFDNLDIHWVRTSVGWLITDMASV